MFFDECHSPWLEVFSWSPYKYWLDPFQNDRQDLPKNLEQGLYRINSSLSKLTKIWPMGSYYL